MAEAERIRMNMMYMEAAKLGKGQIMWEGPFREVINVK